MKAIKVIKAIYNFMVGDMVILIEVALALVVLALIHSVAALAPLKGFSGLLVVAVLATITITLSREAFSPTR